jgi:hypothetical protein
MCGNSMTLNGLGDVTSSVPIRTQTLWYVLKGVEPLYAFLHFADQDKIPNMSKVLLRFHMCTSEYESLLRDYPSDLE